MNLNPKNIIPMNVFGKFLDFSKKLGSCLLFPEKTKFSPSRHENKKLKKCIFIIKIN